MKFCVYGAASTKIDQIYLDAVEELGFQIGSRGHDLVFGAGANGSMGAAARGTRRGGGKIIGVIPEFFRDEVIEEIYDDCDELIFTKTMAERKTTMEDLSDGFIISPGGIGTLEEYFETLTLKQLGRHTKPIAIYNFNNFYDYLEAFMFNCLNQRFIKSNCRLLYLTFTEYDEMFEYLERQTDSFGLNVHDFKDG